jgi:serine/threonine protein kinase/tetratricopeptide (TPR) repeat protein
MLPEPRRDAVAARTGAFTRCDACGRRVALTEPICPLHGPLEEPSQPEGEPPEAESPVFAGYRTLHVIGRGGFGTVFAAEPESQGAIGAMVAIKLARADRPDAALRLVHELAALTDIGPPYAPAVFGSGELPDGSPYVVMEHLAAPTLAERLAEHHVRSAGPLPDALPIALAILRALEVVHARGWVHRDLKPENLFVDDAFRAKIVDYGLVAGGDRGAELTLDGAAVGTAEYMAPEQCERQGGVDARADVYAMGVILHEMLTGAPPFWGAPAAVQQAHVSRRPPRLAAAGLPSGVEAALQRCLAKDRHERFDSATALRAALERAAASPGHTAPPPAPRPGEPGGARASSPRLGDERRTVSLLFFESDADVLAVQKRLVSLGGQLAHASGGRVVIVYGHDLGDNPARPALRAAHELIRGGVATRVRLDVGQVSVQARADGSKRFLSPLFGRAERFPSEADPPGVSVTAAASDVLSDPAAAPSIPPPPASLTPAPSPETDRVVSDTNTDPLIGRDVLIEALVDGARRAATERVATMVSVVADAGLGKSHLLRVLARRLRKLGVPAEVIEMRACEPALGGADRTVRELLHRTLDLPASAPDGGGGELLRERLGAFGAADAAPAVAVALGWVAVGAPGPVMESGLRTLEAAPGALRSALTAAAGEALRRRAARTPVLLLLDDAQHADEATLGALEYAALAEAGAPLWICALARPSFADEHPSWGERAGRREVHRLGALDRRSAADLCRRLLLPVESVPDSAVERLVERAQAVPLLLLELVRGLRRDGLVRRRPGSASYYLATDELDDVPDLPLVEWLARREIDALPAALAAHARLLALLGEEVSIPDVAGVLRRLEEQDDDAEFPLDAGIGTRRLLSAGLLVEDKSARLAFRHGLVREAIAKEVPEAQRRRIHLAAAKHYGAVAGGSSDERRLSQLAFHAARAGLRVVAEAAYRELAERMRARHAYLPAERFYTRALEQLPPGDDLRRRDAYRGRGLMRYRIGRYHDALADLDAARVYAHARGDVADEIEILLDEATALDWMDEYKSSEERVEHARALLRQVSSPLLEARLLLGSGRTLHRFSREEEAAGVIASAAALAATLGDDGYETLVIAVLMLGFIHQGLGHLDEARSALDRCIALCEDHGDNLHLTAAIHTRALLWGCLGDRPRMIADMERGLSLSRELGQDSLELIGQYNAGEYLYLMDELDAAEPHVRRAIEIERRLRGDAGRPVVVLLGARFHHGRGDEAEAREIVAAIRARQDEARATGETDALMVPSEAVMCAAVDLATRDADDAEWDELEARSARYSIGQEHIEVLEMRAVAALRRGRAAAAIRQLERAQGAATRIPNVMGARLRRRLAEARRLT